MLTVNVVYMYIHVLNHTVHSTLTKFQCKRLKIHKIIRQTFSYYISQTNLCVDQQQCSYTSDSMRAYVTRTLQLARSGTCRFGCNYINYHHEYKQSTKLISPTINNTFLYTSIRLQFVINNLITTHSTTCTCADVHVCMYMYMLV